jgi:hypothetical protein
MLNQSSNIKSTHSAIISGFSPIAYKQAVDFLLPRHYSGRKPSITFSFGYFEQNELKAVCTFGKPASNSLSIGVCGKEYKDKVFELNRLCVDGEIQIQLSKFLAWCLNQLKIKRFNISIIRRYTNES